MGGGTALQMWVTGLYEVELPFPTPNHEEELRDASRNAGPLTHVTPSEWLEHEIHRRHAVSFEQGSE